MSNLKINILEILYCELSDIQIKNSIKYIVKKIINNDKYFNLYKNNILGMGLGIGDWGLGIGPNPQSPIPNPQSPKIIIK